MTSDKAPLREYRFSLNDVLEIGRCSNLPGFADGIGCKRNADGSRIGAYVPPP